MSLATGALLSRHRWTELPIPDTAIACVHALAIRDGQPLLQDRGFVVEWRPDHPIDDSKYDPDFIPPAQHPRTDVDNLSDDFASVTSDELADLADPFSDPRDFLPPDQGAIPDTDNTDNTGHDDNTTVFAHFATGQDTENDTDVADTAIFEHLGTNQDDEYENTNDDEHTDSNEDGAHDEGASHTHNTD